MIFDTKTIPWHNDECTILIQNENGPCPLIALVNVLVLDNWTCPVSNRSVRAYTSGKDKIDLDSILGLLAEFIVEQTSRTEQSDKPSGDDGDDENLHPTSEALTYLPRLETGLNVDLKFDGSFSGPELSLFNIYNVKTLHGWICDPESPEWPIIKAVGTYDRSQELLLKLHDENQNSEQHGDSPDSEHGDIPKNGEDGDVPKIGEGGDSSQVANQVEGNEENEASDTHQEIAVISNFMAAYPTQLTPYGLTYISNAIDNNDGLAVVFRNNHFSTLCKHNGNLYTLVTDLGLRDTKDVVWQSLTSISGSDDNFYDAHFETPDLNAVQDKIDQDRARKQERDETSQQDFLLAQQLQQQEDERAASRIHQRQQQQEQRNTDNSSPYSRTSPSGRRSQQRQTTIPGSSRSGQQQSRQSGRQPSSGSKARDKDKQADKEKCIIA